MHFDAEIVCRGREKVQVLAACEGDAGGFCVGVGYRTGGEGGAGAFGVGDEDGGGAGCFYY